MTSLVRHLKRNASALQLEEELQDDLKWCMLTEKILHVEKSKFQDVELVVTGPFGKVRRLMWHAEGQGYTSKHWPARCRWRECQETFLALLGAASGWQGAERRSGRGCVS